MNRLLETRLNSHLVHLEDLVLLGKEGINELNEKIDKFIASFDESLPKGMVASVKVDGAPSVVIWSSFTDYPDNSICLKSFMNSNKNCLSSYEEIESKYGDRPDLALKLRYCLDLSRSIPPGEAWQGDCLYTKNNLKELEVEGQEYLTFHPNKIIYAFTEANPDFEKIKNSSFGICFHTIYTGDLENKTQRFNIELSELSSVPNDIYIMSPELKTGTADRFDIDNILSKYELLKASEHDLLGMTGYQELTENPLFMKYWNMFENKALSDNQKTKFDVDTLIDDLTQYIQDKLKVEFDKKVNSLKTDAGKASAKSAYEFNLQSLYDIINNNRDLIVKLVVCLNLAVDIKMLMLEGYQKSDLGYSSFYKSTSKGYIPANMEGVALSTGPDIVKIVDRSVFSYANRNPDFESDFH